MRLKNKTARNVSLLGKHGVGELYRVLVPAYTEIELENHQWAQVRSSAEDGLKAGIFEITEQPVPEGITVEQVRAALKAVAGISAGNSGLEKCLALAEKNDVDLFEYLESVKSSEPVKVEDAGTEGADGKEEQE